jgi:hypothetical protein
MVFSLKIFSRSISVSYSISLLKGLSSLMGEIFKSFLVLKLKNLVGGFEVTCSLVLIGLFNSLEEVGET